MRSRRVNLWDWGSGRSVRPNIAIRVGVKAQDVTAEMVPDKPLDAATHAVLAQQIVAAPAAAVKYPTVADATAAGYHLVGGGFGPGSGAHYIGGFSMGMDPSRPLALIYDGVSADGTFRTDKIGRCQGS